MSLHNYCFFNSGYPIFLILSIGFTANTALTGDFALIMGAIATDYQSKIASRTFGYRGSGSVAEEP